MWRKAERAADWIVDLPGAVPMFFRRIPKGEFRMGSRGFDPSEAPVHQVCIPNDFYLSTFVVTQQQWRAVAKGSDPLKGRTSPSEFKGSRNPVESVDWFEANHFCQWLTNHGRLPTDFQRARLPAEAEWEYACRGGTETVFYSGDGEEELGSIGWHSLNSDICTHQVDQLNENHPFGLYGMHGNVWEMCADVFDHSAYRKHPTRWAAGPWELKNAGGDAYHIYGCEHKSAKTAFRVVRGGALDSPPSYCSSKFRYGREPDVRDGTVGFRVCLVRGPAASQNS